MQNSDSSSEAAAGRSALARLRVNPTAWLPANDVYAVADAVDLDVRAAWQECLSAPKRYAELARALLAEKCSHGVAARSLGRRLDVPCRKVR
jgi:hypothetical protein